LELATAILGVLPAHPERWTADVVHGELAEDIRPRRGDVMNALRAGAKAGRWQESGDGKKGNPFKFWRGD
jgi:hypothetical protein